MRLRVRVHWIGFLLAAAAPLPAQDAPGARAELDAFAGALSRALARVSRPASASFFPVSGDAMRGYHLKGYGAVFVGPARVLPAAPSRAQQAEIARALDLASRRVEEALKGVQDAELRRRVQASLQALRETEAQLRAGAAPLRPQPVGDDLADAGVELELTDQAEALRREAARTQAELDRALTQIERRVRPQAPGPAKAPADLEPGTPLEAPLPPEPPPWSLWFEPEETEARAPERVIHDVGDAVTHVLETHGARLALLRPDEALVVTVDFVRRAPGLMGFGPEARPRPERTLVVRVRKRELEARRDGKLAAEELRKRIEYVEY
jgi:hypothetical protein